jgi:hypothetical protein
MSKDKLLACSLRGVSLIYIEKSINVKTIPKIEIGMKARAFNL